MTDIIDCLVQDHDLAMVALASVICAAGCFAFVALASQAKTYQSKSLRDVRLLVKALVLAHTVWATHFIAMIGFRSGDVDSFALGVTASSYLVIFVFSLAAICLHRAGQSVAWGAIAGVTFGMGVACMHYLGMAGVSFTYLVEWNADVIALSLVLGLAGSIPAFVILSTDPSRGKIVAAGTLLVLSIAGLHFTGMSAIEFSTGRLMLSADPAERELVVLGVFVATLVVMTIGLTTYMKKGAREIWRRNMLVVALVCICTAAAFYLQTLNSEKSTAFNNLARLITDSQSTRAEMDRLAAELAAGNTTRAQLDEARMEVQHLAENARRMRALVLTSQISPHVREQFLADTAGSNDGQTLYEDMLHYVGIYTAALESHFSKRDQLALNGTGINRRLPRLLEEVRAHYAAVNDISRIELFTILAGLLLISAYQGFAIALPGHRSVVKALNELELEKQYAQKLAVIAERTADAVFVSDRDGQITWGNEAFARMIGVPEDELPGQNIRDIASTSEDGAERYRLALQKREGEDATVLALDVTRGDGSRIWMSLSITPIIDEAAGARRVIHTARDITVQQRLQDELTLHRDQLARLVEERTRVIQNQALELEASLNAEREASRLQSEFVSMASHEFRTPLAIIDGAAHRIDRRANQLSADELRERLGIIRSAVTRMAMLVEKTLDATRLASGRMQLSPGVFDPHKLVRDVCARQSEITPGRAFEIDLDQYPAELFGDGRLLDNVVTNLVSNAVKYSPATAKVEIKGWVENGNALLSVRDHGVGVPAAELPRLFQRFFRASTSTGIAGTGIGLHLVKSVVEMHGGEVSLSSVEGEGTEVTVSLPIESPLHAAPLEAGAASGSDSHDIQAAAMPVALAS